MEAGFQIDLQQSGHRTLDTRFQNRRWSAVAIQANPLAPMTGSPIVIETACFPVPRSWHTSASEKSSILYRPQISSPSREWETGPKIRSNVSSPEEPSCRAISKHACSRSIATSSMPMGATKKTMAAIARSARKRRLYFRGVRAMDHHPQNTKKIRSSTTWERHHKEPVPHNPGFYTNRLE